MPLTKHTLHCIWFLLNAGSAASAALKINEGSLERPPLGEMSVLSASRTGDATPKAVSIRELNAEVMKLRMRGIWWVFRIVTLRNCYWAFFR